MGLTLPVIDEHLAKRIKQSEVDYFTSRILSIGERVGNPEGVEVKYFGSATACYIKTMPWGLFNSVKGFSSDDIDQIENIIQFYNERKRAFQLDINPIDSSTSMLKQLAQYGLYQEGFHSVLYGLPNKEEPLLSQNIKIREVKNVEDFEHYAEIHCVGSGMSVDHKHHFINNNIGLLNRTGWKIFLASLNDIPAAVAVMHISNNIASCTLAATAPEFRNNGLQTALLQRRLYEAHLANCELVVAQASFGSTSQHNMERAGMRIAWTRAVWGPTFTY